MQINEKKIIIISFSISIFLHAVLVGMFYLIDIKPFLPEKENIITISLDTPPLEEKPKISPYKEVLEHPQKMDSPPTPKQSTPVPKPVLEQTKPPEKLQENVNQSLTEPSLPPDNNQLKPNSVQPTPQQPQPQTQKIDLSQGRPDQFKTPQKKEEDVDGYLKDLIRYLNQQARERDLYPPIAKRLKIEGEVIVRLTINEDGTIEENSIIVVESSGYNVLDKGALDILKKLQPFKKPPKKITVEIPIIFQIIYI